MPLALGHSEGDIIAIRKGEEFYLEVVVSRIQARKNNIDCVYLDIKRNGASKREVLDYKGLALAPDLNLYIADSRQRRAPRTVRIVYDGPMAYNIFRKED